MWVLVQKIEIDRPRDSDSSRAAVRERCGTGASREAESAGRFF